MFGKRGLSDIVVTVLIVLLALGAVAIVWAFTKPMFEESSINVQRNDLCLNAEVTPLKCEYIFNYTSTNYTLTNAIVKHASGEEVKKIQAILVVDDGTTIMADEDTPGLLGTHEFAGELNVLNNPNKLPVGLEAAAIIQTEDGELFTCPLVENKIECKNMTSSSSTTPSYLCANGLDDDRDGAVDLDDYGCDSATDNNETGDTQCGDGIDNEGDGYTDQNDSGCSGPSDNLEAFCKDADADGYGVCPDCGTINNCGEDGNDCDDGNNAIYPGAVETCNGKDDDCNGVVDDFCFYPSLLFVPPTPNDGATIPGNSIFVNVSSRYIGAGDHYVFLDVDNSASWLLWLPMEVTDGSGAPVDLSTKHQNIVKVGDAAQDPTGRFGNSFIFDGIGDEVNVTTGNFNFATPYSSFSISLWYRTTIPSGKLLSYGQEGLNGWDLYFSGSRLMFRAFRPGEYNSTETNTYADGKWHHLVFTKGSGTSQSFGNFIIDGSWSPVSRNDWLNPTSATGSLTIGRGFNGEIDDVLIWTGTVLNATTEIKPLYNATVYQYVRNITSLSKAPHNIHAYSVSGAGGRNETNRTITLI
jgi:hypothetical protein